MAPSRCDDLEVEGHKEDDVDEVEIEKLAINDTTDKVVPPTQPDDSSLIRQLRTLAKKQPKLVRGKKYAVPGQSIELTSWKMTEWMYTKSPCPFPTLARGLFTRWIPARGHENEPEGAPGAGKDQIVVRGYDKFFNMNEVKWNTWEALEIHTTSPYTLTLKSNGCIIFMAALTPTELIVTSKHALGEIEGASVSHAQKGEEWLAKHLKKAGKTKAEFAKTLFERNLTAVAELCDDSFEEHVLPYSKEMTGLHLHGLNERRVEFSTLGNDEVGAFAKEWGFIATEAITFDTIDEVKKFTDGVAKEGKWRGEAVEGFVVRTKVSNRPPAPVPAYRGTRGDRIPGKTEQSTPPPYEPGSTFFFKIKFEEPYLMYREWRELTKKMLAANSKGQLRTVKISGYMLRRPETRAYRHWVEDQIRHNPDSLKGFNENHGIIAARERFLEWCKTAEGEAISQKENAQPDGGDSVYKGSNKTIILPVAIPGSGKTAVALALKHIYGFGHTQSDDVKQKKTGPQFVKNVVALFADHDVVFADRNNHIRHLRDSLKEEFKEKYGDKGHIVALQWVFSDTPKKIREICANRIVSRGENHQTLHADGQDSHLGVINQFYNSFEEAEAEEVDDIIDMEYTDTLEQSVKRAISGLAPILDLNIPDDHKIDEACAAARAYTVKSTVTKKAAPKPPRYFALVPEIDLEQRIGNKFDGEDVPDSGKTMWTNLVRGDRIADRPHITLLHVKEKPDAQEFWERCSALRKEAGEIEPTLRVTFDHIVWNDNVMALSVSKVEMHREFEEEHRQLGQAVVEQIPERIEKRLHLTIGTREDSINPFEAASMVAEWRDGAKDGINSIELADSNPGPGSDSMDLDSERGRSVNDQPAVYSNKRPRISNTNTQECMPKNTIVNLPLEILTEICMYIRPSDLLSLARCCKLLRGDLMKKENQSIWRDAMKNVRELPPCPRGFSEPQYLTVLFCNFCTACGTTKKSQLDVTLLVRLCIPCQQECLVQLTDTQEVPADIYEFLHKSNVFGKGRGGQLPEARVLKSDVYSVIQARDKAEKSGDEHVLAELNSQMVGVVLERKAQSPKITYALELHENDVAWERTCIQVKRRQEIERRCTDEFGMKREDFQFPWESREQKKYYQFLNKPGILDDREWGEIRAKVKRLLIANRTARLGKEQEEHHPHQSSYEEELAHLGQPLVLEIDPVLNGLYPSEGIEVLA